MCMSVRFTSTLHGADGWNRMRYSAVQRGCVLVLAKITVEFRHLLVKVALLNMNKQILKF